MDAFTLAAVLTLDSSKFESGLEKSESDFQTFGDKLAGGMKTAAKAIAGSAIVKEVISFGKQAVETGMSFDNSMSQVAATMGYTVDDLNTEGSEASKTFTDLRDFAQEMGAKTAFSASQASDALNYMALAGYTAKDSMEMLPTVLNLAAAGGIQLAYASDMVTDASSALGLSFEQTKTLVDQMAKTSSKTNTSVAQLGEAILTVGGTAKSLQGGTTELNVMLGVLADNGIKGAEGGTALRNVMISLAAPTDKAAKRMKKMGINVYDASGKMRSLPAIFGDLNSKLSTMTENKRTEVLNDLFNKVDLKSVNALLGTNAERWEELLPAIEAAQGAAEEMSKTQLDNLAGDITLFQSALEGAKIAISDVLTPALRTFVQDGTRYVTQLTDAFKEKGLSGAIEEAGKILGEIGGKIKTAFDWIDWLQLGSDILNGILGGLGDIVGTFTTIFYNVSAAIAGTDWFTLGSNIWNAIIGGIGDIVSWFSTQFENVTTAIKEIHWDEVGMGIFDFISAPFVTIADWFVARFGEVKDESTNKVDWAGLGTDISTFITNAISGIVSTITGFFEEAKRIAGEIKWDELGNAILTAITGAVSSIVTDLTTFFTNAKTAISEIDWVEVGSNLRGKIEDGVKAISEWFSTTFEGIIGAIGELGWAGLGEAIVGLIKEGLAALDGLFTGLLGENWENFKKAFEDLTPVIAGVGAAAFVVAAGFAATKAAMAITDVITKVQTGFSEMFAVIAAHPFMAVITAIVGLGVALVTAYNTNEEFKAKVDKAWETIKTTAQTVWTTVSSAVELAFEAIQKAWDAVSGFFTETIPQAWNDLQSTASSVFGVIKGTIDGAIKVIETAWGAVSSFFSTTIPDAWDQLKAKADEIFGPIKTAITDAITAVQGAWTEIQKFFGIKPKDTPNFESDVNKGVTTPMNNASSAIQGLLGEMASLEAKDGKHLASTTSSHTHTEHTIYTFEGSSGQKHTGSEGKFAKAMFGGKILRGATMFGWDAQGRPQIGGGEGAEAVVGVNSLNQQIREAVRDGLSGIVGSIAQAIGGRNEQPVYVVLDTGELVGAIGGKMDAELGKIGDWKGGGRA